MNPTSPALFASRRSADERLFLEPGSAWPLIVGLGACLLAFAFFLLAERQADRRRSGPSRLLWRIALPVLFGAAEVLVIQWTQSRWNLYPLAIVAASLCLRKMSDEPLAGSSGSARWPAAIAAGIGAGLPLLWTWGSLDPIPAIHDEASYALQARIFAAGRWTAPAPPIPEFFEQMHVLVTPMYASKYFPGHALTIAPGNWLGLPGLVPLVLLCLTTVLLFVLAREAAGGPVAWVTVAVWITAPIRHFRPSFFSQVTTAFCLLLSWWLLSRWKRTGRCAWLCALAAVVAWGAVARPYSMLLLSVPIGVAVLIVSARRKRWACVFVAAAVAVPILMVVPLWCRRSTGRWMETPLAVYTRAYMPYDHLGFSSAATTPSRPLPADLDAANRRLEATQRDHTARALPSTARKRATAILRDMFGGERLLLLLPAAFGLLSCGPPGWLALSSAGALFCGYWFYWHDDFWTPYYLEIQPVLAYVTAVGIWLSVRKAFGIRPGAISRRAAAATLLTVALLGFAGAGTLVAVRAETARLSQGQRRFRSLVRSLPDAKAVVFVRYARGHNADASLIDNDPILDRSRAWIVYDRGADNERLLALAVGRTAYLYDEATGRLWKLSRQAPSSSP